MPRSWRDALTREWGWRAYLAAGVLAGAVAFLVQVVRGDWRTGAALFVALSAGVGPLAYLRAQTTRNAAEAGAAWRSDHPEQAARLRRVVLPVLAAAFVVAVAALVAEATD